MMGKGYWEELLLWILEKRREDEVGNPDWHLNSFQMWRFTWLTPQRVGGQGGPSLGPFPASRTTGSSLWPWDQIYDYLNEKWICCKNPGRKNGSECSCKRKEIWSTFWLQGCRLSFKMGSIESNFFRLKQQQQEVWASVGSFFKSVLFLSTNTEFLQIQT